MKPQVIVTGLVLAIIIFYVLWTRIRTSESRPDTDTRRPSQTLSPTQTKQNDKLVIVKGVSHPELKQVLTGFCNIYNKESFQARPRLVKLKDQVFAITFPYNINFDIFCYFINYIQYPMKLKWSPDVTAWTTTKSSDTWITGNSTNQKVMLFVPTDDTEHDNVYMTTQDNIGYKIGFAMGEGHQLLDKPKKNYVQPAIEISNLTNEEFEDYK